MNMPLKQLTDIQRIFFLKEFTFQLIINSVKDEELRKLIEIEKIKKKYLGQKSADEYPKISSIFEHEFEMSPSFPTQINKKVLVPPSFNLNYSKTDLTHAKPHLILKQNQLKQSQFYQKSRGAPEITPDKQSAQTPPQSSKQLTQKIIQPSSELADNESLKKIDNLIKDVAVQMIECPGTEKNILVKVRNKISITRIILNESEINNIINYFSKNAKIPVSEGVLNAAVGSLLISAVVSEYAGSRFIITKKSPYELIDGIRQ